MYNNHLISTVFVGLIGLHILTHTQASAKTLKPFYQRHQNHQCCSSHLRTRKQKIAKMSISIDQES